jgi:hypothetical protein
MHLTVIDRVTALARRILPFLGIVFIASGFFLVYISWFDVTFARIAFKHASYYIVFLLAALWFVSLIKYLNHIRFKPLHYLRDSMSRHLRVYAA